MTARILQPKIYNRTITQFYFVIITFLSSHALSQSELDETFLNSLPDSYQKRIKTKESAESSEIERLFNSDTTLEKNKEILFRIKEDLSNLEGAMNSSLEENQLERFGDKFFKTVQSSFMPINLPNPQSSYLIGAGDSFTILLTGSEKRLLKDIFVNRDGSLNIDEIGSINVQGKTLSEAETLINDFISIKAVGVSASISLSKMRDMQILVTGGSNNPGIYTVNGASSILSLIAASGGISENGSYREILHKRNGKTIRSFDLYDIFVNGNLSSHKLMSGDSILIKPIKKLIPISGGVNFPAIFELKDGEDLATLIDFAGGLSSSNYGFDYIEVIELTSSGFNNLQIGLNETKNYKLKHRDSVIVPSYKNDLQVEKTVSIQGMVQKPGTYVINEGEKLSQLIKRAGGYKENAYLYGASLFRQNVIEQEKYFAERKFLDSIKFIVSSIGKPGVNISPQAIEFLETELRATPYLGRVVTEFDLDKISINPVLDTELLEDDVIVIPELQKVVFLFGDLINPITLRYESGLTVYDYLAQTGGFEDSATRDLVVINPNGVSTLYANSRFPFKKNVDVYPGSIIYSPNDTGKLDGVMYASTIAPILSSLALAAASLNSIAD